MIQCNWCPYKKRERYTETRMAHKDTHTHTHTHRRKSCGGGDRDGRDAAASPETPRTAGSHQKPKRCK